jgi:uncharacterized glyoxalase superfamily metalloenzyme YdcJ
MSQIRDALAQAGYSDAEEWPSKALLEVVEKAVVAHADDTRAAQNAIFDACCGRNTLARALFAPWQREVTSAVIAEWKRLLKASQNAEKLTDRRRRATEIIMLEDERAAAAAQIARQRLIEERGRAAYERQKNVNAWLSNKARSEVIDGTSWWEITPARLREYTRRTTHRSKFYALVLDRIPSHDDQRPISYYLRPDEVNPLWDEAWGNETPV